MKKLLWITIAFCSIVIVSCTNEPSQPDTNTESNKVASLSYSIISTLPHDTTNFTEGLEIYQNTLLESTGNYGKSKLVQTDLKSGKILKLNPLLNKFFGEGITVLHDTIYH